MTNTANTTESAKTETPCLCSQFDAVDDEQLTEENLASGDYDSWDTGCTSQTANTFAPGHDAKLKSFLIRHGAQGHSISRMVGGARVSADAENWASKFDFGYMVLAGLAKAQERAEAKAKRDAARAERKAAKAKKPLAETVADEEAKHAEAEAAKVTDREASYAWTDAPGGTIKAKVGRWEYDGHVNENGEFVYQNRKSGKTETTKKYTLV